MPTLCSLSKPYGDICYLLPHHQPVGAHVFPWWYFFHVIITLPTARSRLTQLLRNVPIQNKKYIILIPLINISFNQFSFFNYYLYIIYFLLYIFSIVLFYILFCLYNDIYINFFINYYLYILRVVIIPLVSKVEIKNFILFFLILIAAEFYAHYFSDVYWYNFNYYFLFLWFVIFYSI